MSNRSHDRDQVLFELRRIIADKFDISESQANSFSPNEPLFGGSLGFDSLDALELGMYVEEEFGITLGSTTEARAALTSIGHLADFISTSRHSSPAISCRIVTA